jgi:CrcB protein
LTRILFVGLGGCVGAIARFLIGNYLQGLTRTTLFPYGTLAVNLIGCLLIGFLFYLPPLHKTFDTELRLLLITGLLGGFTTFSAFGNESLQLIQHQQGLRAAVYIGTSLVFGLGAVWLGQRLAEWLGQ